MPSASATKRSSRFASRAASAGTALSKDTANNRTTGPDPDGRMTPIGVSTPFPTLPPGPGVLTPPFAAPQVPWVGNVRRFLLWSVDQSLPDPPPSLRSSEWAEAFNQIKAYGAATGSARTDEQTAIARFWSANVIHSTTGPGAALPPTASACSRQRGWRRWINLVGADALMSTLYAKYHYLYWRPVTAIDPTAVTADGCGPVPGYDDGNPGTAEQTGWRPLLTTPNHPEYPAAHGVITSAMAEVFSTFLGTNQIDLDIHGLRRRRTGREPERGTALRHAQRPPPRDHRRPVLGGAALPLLRPRRRRLRPQGREIRPQACLSTHRLTTTTTEL